MVLRSAGATEDLFVTRGPHQEPSPRIPDKEKAEKAAAFLVRDNNSSEMPGKKDQKRVGNDYVAKRTFCETMENLHKRYNKEYPFPPVSLSVFKRARPEHVLLLQDTKHNMCLCERHENFRLLMAAVRTPQVLGQRVAFNYFRGGGTCCSGRAPWRHSSCAVREVGEGGC